MTTALNAIAFKAQTHPKHRFQNLYGLLTIDSLYQGWKNLNKKSVPGIDGVNADQFTEELTDNLTQLAMELKTGHYRTDKVKRIFIPKSNGKERPLGLPTLKDKVVQQSVADILQSIWEADFLPYSYGYRPNKSSHQAIKSLQVNLQFSGYGYLVEADIKGFFNHMDHEWLMRMLAQRIDDKRLLNLINQWLKAAIVSPDGLCEKPLEGTPQGGVISPILANIYLHYALDLWFEKRVKPNMKGRAMLIRYADDYVVAFQYQQDAKAFYRCLASRLAKFKLSLAPEKTALKRFSRFHPSRKQAIEFLGFQFYWDTDFQGKARLRRRTAPKKHKAILKASYEWIKKHRHKPIGWLIPALARKVRGLRYYFALPDNSYSVGCLFDHILRSLYKWLNRRSQRKSYRWDTMKAMLKHFQFPNMRIQNRFRFVRVDWYS